MGKFMAKFKSWFAAHMVHLAWAIWAQECSCGHDRFNWLARIMQRWGSYDPNRDEAQYKLGCRVYDFASRLDPELEGM